jgi:hypothetical protein
MSLTVLKKLTQKQLLLISTIGEKWRKIPFSTERIDRGEAIEAIQAAYAMIGKSSPKILFFDSPYAALQSKQKFLRKNQLKNPLTYKLTSKMEQELENMLWRFLDLKLVSKLDALLENIIDAKRMMEINLLLKEQLKSQLKNPPWEDLENAIQSEVWGVFHGIWYDFFISVLNCTHSQTHWEAIQSLVKFWGWIFPYENICLVSERPIKLSFDNQAHLHAVGEPALEFADRFCVYAYHGLRLPEKYGALHPTQWQARWLLEEKNEKLRDVLIQGIGYERLASQLQAMDIEIFQNFGTA